MMLALFLFNGSARHGVLRQISELTDMLVYFSHAYCKFQHFPFTKGSMCVWARLVEKGKGKGGGKKERWRKISTSRHLHQNENK